ncbi:MAG: hypothetical protein ACJ75Z_00550 [Solirubrobacterales bacterium]
MNTEERAFARAEVADEVSKWTVGAGVILVALFPLSLPILILTAVALLPLLLLAVPLLLVAALVAAPVALVRRRRRRAGPTARMREIPAQS